ncbi:MAG TPA: hypothetical protein VNT60_04115 [Deinococcales bacterium]|nr:hypothetical protein [Deinococcales bacterium]
MITRFLARVVFLLALGLSVCFGGNAFRADAAAQPAAAPRPADLALAADLTVPGLRVSLRTAVRASQGAFTAAAAVRGISTRVPVAAAAQEAVKAAAVVTAKPPAPATKKPVVAAAPAPRRNLASFLLMATGYNSLRGQTDSTPFITATGARTRFGVVALSRDMLRRIPYGSQVVIEDLSGRYTSMLRGMTFVVEDTMHPRKTGQVDIWFPAYRQAISWGKRRVRLTVVRYGRG